MAAAVQTILNKELAFGNSVFDFECSFLPLSGKAYNLGTNSASAAAYMLFAYLYDKYGECDVYTPSLGFSSPAWAAKKNGHNLMFVDVNKQCLFSAEDYLLRRIENDRQKVLMPVLYGGVGALPDFNLVGDELVVLDAAHCVTPNIDCHFSFFSFHPTKPICMASGGILATDDEEAHTYFQKYRNFGRVPSNDSYDIVQNGFKFYMDSLNASIGMSQIDSILDDISARRHNYLALKARIPWGRFLKHDHNSSYYLGTLVLPCGISNIEVRKALFDAKIDSALHYPPLHKTSFFDVGDYLPQTEQLCQKIVTLPIHQGLSNTNIRRIVAVTNNILRA